MPQGIISRIKVRGLFGLYDYDIPKNGVMHSPAILYGDNGVGKSTILNLAFHLLSSAGDRGHRTAIHRISFKEVYVELSNGYRLGATRSESYEDDGIIVFSVFLGEELISEWNHSTQRANSHFDIDFDVLSRLVDTGVSPKGLELSRYWSLSGRPPKDQVKRGEKEYLTALSNCTPNIFYLNADRRLDSDSVSDPSDEMELRQILNQRELKRMPDILRASRGISLKQALITASRWVSRKAVRSVNVGSENVHGVYQKIIEHISTNYDQSSSGVGSEDINDLLEEIDTVERDAKAFSKYEFIAELRMEKFRSAITTGNPRVNGISAQIIRPYVRSLASRLEATRHIYQVLDKFVTTVNSFLSRKYITYGLSQGFQIRDDHGSSLEPSQLSSGEQQLLLIFSYVLAAREAPSVFIIDEPEISLNIKWQRMMVASLLEVASGSEIQFLLASHSIEILTQHDDSVIPVG